MNIALWIVQAILAGMFTMSGFMKVSTPKAKMIEKFPWAQNFSEGTIKFIGTTQILGAIGLILPMLTGIMPILTPIAASGLLLTMLLAAYYHITHDEVKSIGINIALGALAAFVAVGRF